MTVTTTNCENCDAPLAGDQRYCINCGERTGEQRVKIEDAMNGTARAPAPPQTRWFEDRRVWALGAAGAVAGALLVVLGVLLGGAGAEEKPPVVNVSVPEQKAPVVNVTNTGGGAAPVEEFISDWPEGVSGWTVQLQTLPNTTSVSEVTAAETAATTAGAEGVGSLNSDDFTSLPTGLYIVYSGVYEGKKGKGQAQKAVKGLKKDFPEAKVIKVAGGGGDTGAASSGTADKSTLKDLESSSGEEQQKKSAQLPEELSLGGKAPPKDNKKPEGQKDPGGVVIE